MVNSEIQTALASAESVYEILDAESTIVDYKDAKPITNLQKSLSFKNVHFSYEDSKNEVLKRISFEINRGEVVAVVGKSGAGKSTIADLIPRFFEVSDGSIEIDGKDIRSLKKRSLRALMGIVPQETILFNDTIANNIAYGQSGISENSLRKAALACLLYTSPSPRD